MPGQDLDLTLPTAGQANWSGPLNTVLQTIIDDIEEQIVASELLLNGDITLSPDGTAYSINGARSIQLANNAAAYSGSANIGRAYRLDNDLYFLDGDGNNIRITANGAVNVTISGAVSFENWAYSSANQQLTGYSDDTTVAKLLIGDVSFRERTAGVTNVVTVSSPDDLAASYDIKWPTAAAAGDDYFLKINNAGDMSHTNQPTFNTISVAGTSTLAAITSTNGISFNGGSVLSFYETGTYTPVMQINGVNTTATYAEQEGTYLAIGPMVWVNIHVRFGTAEAASTDTIRFTLPATMAPVFTNMTDYAGSCGKMTSGSPRATSALIDNALSTTHVYLRHDTEPTPGPTSFTLTTTGLDIALSICYRRA